MYKYLCVAVLAFGLAAPPAFAQDYTIEKVWEYFNKSESNPLPILVVDTPPPDDDYQGNSLWDSYNSLRRYDENRLLLAVRENGVRETDAGHDAALSAAYPDRSLIWINAGDGAPMGVALVVGNTPVELDQDFLDAGGSAADYYFAMGISDDGVVFIGYKNKVLRYAPEGDGFGAPTVAFTKSDNGDDTWSAWRWTDIEVMGSGPETVILASCKTWRPQMGAYYLTTTDGLNFTETGSIPNGYGNVSGGVSKLVIHGGLDPFFPDTLVAYGSSYPGSDGGMGTSFYRYWWDAEIGEFVKDGDFWTAEKLGDADSATEYRTEFITDADSANGLPYVVAYSTPSWNSLSANGGVYAPGWLAVHDASGSLDKDGAILSSHMIGVYESDEMFDAETADWHGALGEIDVNIPAAASEGACEILWCGGQYGYGRYIIGDTSVGEWSIF